MSVAEEKPWRRYEREILDLLRDKAGQDAIAEPDVHLLGRMSGVKRQVDILVTGKFGNLVDSQMAVDCKCWNGRVDVSDVDRFVGYVEDLGVQMGLLITNQGYTEGAKRRAANARGILLWVVPFDDLDEWEPSLAWCGECRFAHPDWVPGAIDWSVTDGVEGAAELGNCDRCSTPYVHCDCGAITALPDVGDWPCEGCEKVWRLDPEGYESRRGGESLADRLHRKPSRDEE